MPLKRYYNSTTGHNYYSTSADQPSGFTEQATLGYLDSSSGTGLNALYRHFNSTFGDYLLSTSSTPPSGYVLQATLGYLQLGSNVTTYIRNPIGQVVQAKTADVTYNYTYDAAHRLQSVNDSRGNKTISYALTAAGRRVAMQDSDGNRTDYQYDPVGRLTGIWAPNNQLTSFVYDDGGRLAEKWFPNGVNSQYRYNADNTLAQLINRHSSGMIISQHDYNYDGIGNRNSHKELIGGVTTPCSYGYDNLNRLTSVNGSETYAYDPLGNRRTKTVGGSTLAYVYDNANQLLEIHSGSAGGPLTAGLVYDNNGNLQKKCDGGTVTVSPTSCTGSTVTDLTHDSFNRLAQVSKTGISAEAYKGRRIQKTIGATPTNYLYDGPDIVGEYTNTWGSPAAILTHGPAMDDPILRVASAAAKYFHQDGLGSVVGVTNQAGGTDGTARYDAYGIKLASTGTIPQYGYTGREPDETGFIYYRARFYDPGIGRFIQRDPIRLAGGVNTYTYVGNNPTRLIDPSGLSPVDSSATNQQTQSVSYYGSSSGISSGAQNLAEISMTMSDTEDEPLVSGGNYAWASQTRAGIDFHVHQEANRRAIGGFGDVTSQQIETINSANVLIDSAQYQTGQWSYLHGMRNENQTVGQASALANDFVRSKFDMAWQYRAAGDINRSLFEFGLALHTLQDANSPSHIGFQVWTGREGPIAQLTHALPERNYPGDNSALFRITQRAYQWYRNGALPSGDLFGPFRSQ